MKKLYLFVVLLPFFLTGKVLANATKFLTTAPKAFKYYWAPVINVSSVTGSINACIGAASASPNIQQFTVSGNSLTGNITATAPTGFEVSTSAGSGYSTSVVLTQSGGSVSTTTVYVRSAASAAPGNISGNVALSSPGVATQNVAVAASIKAPPIVNPVISQTIANGTTGQVNFTGTASTFNWVNSNPAVGLPASGTGNIAFTAVNKTSTSEIATITVTPSHIDGLAYIANLKDSTVSVINLATNTVIATIPVGVNPDNVTVSPDGSRAYVANSGSNTISVINTTSNTVIATVNVGTDPTGIAVSPDGSKVYVNDSNSAAISVISAITNTVITTISGIDEPGNITINNDGSLLYVSNFGSIPTIYVISTATNSIIANIRLNTGTRPNGLVLSPDASKLYVANAEGQSFSIINTATNTVSATIPLLATPERLLISPDGSKLYLLSTYPAGIWIINTSTNAVIQTIEVGSNPEDFSMSADGSMFYISDTGLNNAGPGNVFVVNMLTGTVVSTITVGRIPVGANSKFITGQAYCPGTSITFTITVPPISPTITSTGTLSALSTTQGTASQSTTFTVEGTDMTTGILVTAPQGFEVSTDNATFSNTVTIGTSGTIAATVVYVRLTASALPGAYSGIVMLSSAGAASVNTAIPASLVTFAQSNFKLAITSTTCKGTNDGSINITAAQNLNYTATITGNGLNTPYSFTTSTAINNLAAGTYNVCITVDGQANYQQCYSAVVTEPQDLSVYSTINDANKTITLAMTGGNQYNIQLNGANYSTTDNSMTLPLAEGNNDLTVTTNKLCQGTLQKVINISGKISPYPVPFQNTLYLNLGNTMSGNVAVEIHDVSTGKQLYSKQFGSQSGVLQLDVSNLDYGAYVLHLTMDRTEKIFKIIKK